MPNHQQFDVAVPQPRRSSIQTNEFLFDSYAPSRQSVPVQMVQSSQQPQVMQVQQPQMMQTQPQQMTQAQMMQGQVNQSQMAQAQMMQGQVNQSQMAQAQMMQAQLNQQQLNQPQMMQPQMMQMQGHQQTDQTASLQQQPPRQSLQASLNQQQMGGYDLDDLMGNQNTRASYNFQTNAGVHAQTPQPTHQSASNFSSLPAGRFGQQASPPQPIQTPVIHQNAYMQSHLQGVQQASQMQPQTSDFDNFDSQFATAGPRRPQTQQPVQQHVQQHVQQQTQQHVQQQTQQTQQPASSNQDPFGGFNFDFGSQPAQSGFSNEFFGGPGAQASSSDVFEFKASSKPKPQTLPKAVPDFNNFFGDASQQRSQSTGMQPDFGFGIQQPQPAVAPRQQQATTQQSHQGMEFSLAAGPTQTADFGFSGHPTQAPQKPQDRYSAFDDIKLSSAQTGPDLPAIGMQLSFGSPGMQLPQMQSAQLSLMGYQSQSAVQGNPQLQPFNPQLAPQSLDPFQFAAQQSLAGNNQLPQTGSQPVQVQQPPQMTAEKKQAINAQLSALEDLLI